MTEAVTQRELEQLQTFRRPFCVTVYVPFIAPNTATNPNRIALKNLLNQAKRVLLAAGANNQAIRKTLQPGYALLDNGEFWPVRHEGLALFMHATFFRIYHLPNGAQHLSTVGSGFYTEPLLALAPDNKPYFLLTLSHNNVRLYEGDYYSLQPVHLKNFPTNLKKTLAIDEQPRWQETHSVAPAYMGKGSEAYHGQYNVSQTDKIMLGEFFRRIDRRIHSLLNRQKRPLIIAGVRYLLPIYNRFNTYAHLVPQPIVGNMDKVASEELRRLVWPIVQQYA